MKLETQTDAHQAIPDLPHPQVTIVIHGQDVLIDVKMVTLVQLFNLFPGFETISSCQGSPYDGERSVWDGHIVLHSDKPGWLDLCRFGFETLAPLMKSAETFHQVALMKSAETFHQVALSDEHFEKPTLWITFPQSSIPQLEIELANLWRASVLGDGASV